jgi:Protein of unknown function (DUF1232)
LQHAQPKSRALLHDARVKCKMFVPAWRLIPDFIPIIGQFDEALVVELAIRTARRSSTPELVRQHWPGPQPAPNSVLRRAKGRSRSAAAWSSASVETPDLRSRRTEPHSVNADVLQDADTTERPTRRMIDIHPCSDCRQSDCQLLPSSVSLVIGTLRRRAQTARAEHRVSAGAGASPALGRSLLIASTGEAGASPVMARSRRRGLHRQTFATDRAPAGVRPLVLCAREAFAALSGGHPLRRAICPSRGT